MRVTRFSPRGTLRLLWLLAAGWYALTWFAGFGWVGIGWVLTAWTYWALPLYAGTAIAVFGRTAVTEYRRVWIPVAVWLALLALCYVDPDTVGGIQSLRFRVGAAALEILGSLLPLAIITHGYRLSSRVDLLRQPRSASFVAVLALILITAPIVFFVRESLPDYRVAVFIRRDATPDEVERVWNEVLSTPSPVAGQHRLLEGISGVGRAGIDDRRTVLHVSFRGSTTRKERDRVVGRLKRSEFVDSIADLPRL